MNNSLRKEKALQLYTLLLKFYPPMYRSTFGSQMQQTFKDHYTDVVNLDGKAGIEFWFDVVKDEIQGIMREQIVSLTGGTAMKNIWVRQGILFGITLAAVQIIYNLINNLAPANETLNNLIGNGLLIFVVLLPAIAGYSVGHATNKVEQGIYAGLLTSFFSTVIGMTALMIITFVFMDTIRHNAFMISDFQHSGSKNMDQFIIEDALGAVFFGTCFAMIIGGIVGTLGGYLGTKLRGSLGHE